MSNFWGAVHDKYSFFMSSLNRSFLSISFIRNNGQQDGKHHSDNRNNRHNAVYASE